MSAPESPSGVLRRAAGLMREYAGVATKGPWRAVAGTWEGETFAAVVAPEGDPANAETWLMATGRGSICQEADAKHAAFWHPGVAQAVAAMLESRATEYDELASSGYGITGAWFVAGADGGDEDPAIATARAYLGEAAS